MSNLSEILKQANAKVAKVKSITITRAQQRLCTEKWSQLTDLLRVLTWGSTEYKAILESSNRLLHFKHNCKVAG